MKTFNQTTVFYTPHQKSFKPPVVTICIIIVEGEQPGGARCKTHVWPVHELRFVVVTIKHGL